MTPSPGNSPKTITSPSCRAWTARSGPSPDGIRGIAQATGDEYAQRQLTGSYHRLVQASAGVRLALSSFDDEPDEADEKSGKELETAAEPAALAASSFPQPMTAGVLQEAAPASATGATAAVARPAMASPRQSR